MLAAYTHAVIEADDGTPHGWDHRDFARLLGTVLDRRVLPVPVPGALMALGARVDGLVRGPRARLTPDRVGYLCHPDWSAAPDRRPPAALWAPLIDTPAGLAATARWYRAHGLL